MSDKKPDNGSTAAGEYLSFTLGDEHYGVDILKVQEIRGYDSVTRVPDAPEYIKGVINLRGKIVPVVDLRLKLGMEERAYDQMTCVVILEIGTSHVGLVVDDVQEVVNIPAAQRSAPPAEAKNLAHVAQRGKDVALLFDCRRLFEKELPKVEA